MDMHKYKITYCYMKMTYFIVTSAGSSQCMSRVISCICILCVCLSVSLFVHTLKGKWLELSTPKLV